MPLRRIWRSKRPGKKGLTQALADAGAVRGTAIGWGDEFRIGLLGQTRRVLAPRGRKVIQPVELVRDWYHLGVIVNPRTGQLTWSWLVSTKGIDLAPAVADWRAQGFEALVWDGEEPSDGRRA